MCLVGSSYFYCTQEIQEIAAELSSVVNKAYGTLLNPFTRAEYIMQLEDVHIGESESLDDQELIMEIMDAREELDSVENREDADRIQVENEGTSVIKTDFLRLLILAL